MLLVNNKQGLKGLQNLQNTCYLNSAIQILSNCPPFLKFILEKHGHTQLSDETNINNTLTNQIALLFQRIWSNDCNGTIFPHSFRQILCSKKSEFKGSNQHDSQEALSAIIDIITVETSIKCDFKFDNLPKEVVDHNNIVMFINNKLKEIENLPNKNDLAKEIKKFYYDYKMKNNKTIILSKYYLTWKKYLNIHHSLMTDIFAGSIMTNTMCLENNCGYSSPKFEIITILNLPIKGTTLIDCLDSYFEDETMDDDNKWLCDKCNKNVIPKRETFFVDIPKVLIISLNRFLFTKINDRITIPIELNINSYIKPINNNVNQITDYTLCGIINHSGGMNSGHYTTTSRNGDAWYKFNDESVNIIKSHDDVLKTGIDASNAYVVMYVKNN